VTWVNVPPYRISLEGHLAAGEIFATTFWCGGAGSSDAQTVANLIVTALGTNGTGVTTMLARIKDLLGTADGWDRVRVYKYASGSNLATSSAIASISNGTGTGGRAGPFQQALVVTLQTAGAGRSRRGRMYMPYAGGATTSGFAVSTTVDKACTAIGDLFGYIKNNPVAGLGVPVVWSATHDYSSPVTALRCDSKIDIQRRRAVKIAADYSKSYTGLG